MGLRLGGQVHFMYSRFMSLGIWGAAIFGSALWAPALWTLLMEVNERHNWHESFTAFHNYGLYGLLITWAGGLPLSLATALLVRRTSVWILAPVLVWFLLVAMVFLVLVGGTAPGGGVKMGFGGVSHDRILVTVLVMGVLLSGSAIPILLCTKSANLRWVFRDLGQKE